MVALSKQLTNVLVLCLFIIQYHHNKNMICRMIYSFCNLIHNLQIEEVRLRLNVDVTVTPDSPSAPAPAPIESFTDMVNRVHT